MAFVIIDAKAMGSFVPPVYPPHQAPSVRELAQALNLDPAALERTVTAFNRAVRPGTFNHAILDDCTTVNLTPVKSHWARPSMRPLLRVSAPARHHLHLPGGGRERPGPGADAG